MRRNAAFPWTAALGAVWIPLSVLFAAANAGAEIVNRAFSGSLSIEGRWYPDTAAYPRQRAHASGLTAAPELYLEDAEGRSVTVAAFLRYDAGDPERTHVDLREAYLLLLGEAGDGEWELRLGIDRVFWGVAESRNPVDIVNQTDLVEHPDGKVKLGQPMVHLTWSADWGVTEIFALPYHRARTYPGRAGRLRPPLVVDRDQVSYESAAEEWHLDVAARYSHGFGPLDIGVSVFDGTAREPFLVPGVDRAGVPVLVPHYDQLRQFGLDAQLTTGAWLLKLEGVHRAGARNAMGMEEDHGAFVVGGEHTFHSVFGSDADLGLIGEWNHDERGGQATSQFQNDLLLAARVAFNDVQGTEIVAGVLADTDYATRTLTVELDRRLSDRWSVRLEAVALLHVDDADILLHATRRDSFVALKLQHDF